MQLDCPLLDDIAAVDGPVVVAGNAVAAAGAENREAATFAAAGAGAANIVRGWCSCWLCFRW